MQEHSAWAFGVMGCVRPKVMCIQSKNNCSRFILKLEASSLT